MKAIDEFAAETQGWLSLENPLNFLFDGPGLLDYERPLNEGASAFEIGTHNRVGCAGLLAAATLIDSVSPHSTFEHVQRYHDLVEPLFVKSGFVSVRGSTTDSRSTILSFAIPNAFTSSTVVSHFADHGIILTAPDGHLRIAPHYWNSLGEVAMIEDALERLPPFK